MIAFETDRLTVRNFRSEDAAGLFEYLHRPSARCFLSLALADLTAAETEARRRSKNDDYLAICLKENGRLIGDLFGIAEPFDHIDRSDTFGVGWNINPAFGGVGYAFEAASALFEDLFTTRHARRLYAYVDQGNVASERLCVRLGMRQEGMFREFISFVNDEDGDPVFENITQYAILGREWLARRLDASPITASPRPE